MGKGCFSILALGGFFIGAIFIGPGRLYLKAVLNFESPQMILVLGGDVDREHVGVRLASNLKLPLVVSGGSNPEHAIWLINNAGISPDLVKLDYRAHDTLSNFTSLVDELVVKGVNHTLLVTSEDHLKRAMTVGWIVAGSRGIHLTGISVPCKPLCEEEHVNKYLFDLARSITWVLTGKDLRTWAKKQWPKAFADFSVSFPLPSSQKYLLDPYLTLN